MGINRKVEYKVLKQEPGSWFDPNVDLAAIESVLNKLGQEGWDVVSSFDTNYNQGGTKEIILLLKRYLE